jgi:hypothetical protein
MLKRIKKIKMSCVEKIERNEKDGREKIMEEKKKGTRKKNREKTILDGEKRRCKKKEEQKQRWKDLVKIIRKMEYRRY